MPIRLNNKNGTQVYHREVDNTSRFSIFGSDHQNNKIGFGYVEVENVPRNNYGFFGNNSKRPESYYNEGITQSKIKTQAPVWALVGINSEMTPLENTQQIDEKPVMTIEGNKRNNSKKFTWPYGGNIVYLTGTFDHWQTSIPMTPVTGTDINNKVFEVTVENLDLSKDVEYKFVVDGEWCYDVQKDFIVDALGNVNNIIHVEV